MIRLLAEIVAGFAETTRRNARINAESSRRARLIDAIVIASELSLKGSRRHVALVRLQALYRLIPALHDARDEVWAGRPTQSALTALRALRELVAFNEAITERLDPLIEELETVAGVAA